MNIYCDPSQYHAIISHNMLPLIFNKGPKLCWITAHNIFYIINIAVACNTYHFLDIRSQMTVL